MLVSFVDFKANHLVFQKWTFHTQSVVIVEDNYCLRIKSRLNWAAFLAFTCNMASYNSHRLDFFLGGLSLHLNHLIAPCMGICYRQFRTLPIGIFIPFKLSTLHAVNGRFVFQWITRTAIAWTPDPKKKTTKNSILVYILLHIYANLWLQILKFGGSKKIGNFLTSQKLPLYGPANDQSVTYSKIYIKVCRTP